MKRNVQTDIYIYVMYQDIARELTAGIVVITKWLILYSKNIYRHSFIIII